jgi:protein-L-isoaspartate(D-aspartate) O-methyltransferase
VIDVRQALAQVPREHFIPDLIYVPDATTGWLVPLERSRDPEGWRRAVAEDGPVVIGTEFDPRIPAELRDPGTGRGVRAISSSSAPHVMARMLEALELRPGLRVLEIGTGSGYNAAVLAHLLGAQSVTSVEVDPDLAGRARGALKRTGYPVEVVVGDGAQGYKPHAPYDRILATAAVDSIPEAWLGQTRPGGLILAPWTPTLHPAGPLALVTVASDGSAEGRFIGPGEFMPLRRAGEDPPRDPSAHHERIDSPDCTRYRISVAPDGAHRIRLD